MNSYDKYWEMYLEYDLLCTKYNKVRISFWDNWLDHFLELQKL